MISLRNVSKRFKLYRRPSDLILEWLHFGKRHEEFFALNGIDLEVPRGRTIGIVGANGAGKSTLLKLITGTLLPTTGSIEIFGRIAALLELGTGFHPDFTGRQNIYVNGQFLGLSHEEIQALEPEIIEFSELGGFIDQPLRTYSSGMVVRLGFSIAASVNPEVLIVDEALSVGDARFAQKCVHRIQKFRDQGTTILFVSHDPAAISQLCDEAILLESGQVQSRGAPKDILSEYNALLAAKGQGNVSMRISRPGGGGPGSAERLQRHGTFQALITALELCREDGSSTEDFHSGETMKIRIRAAFLTHVSKPSIGFLIKDRLGLSIYGTNTNLKKLDFGPMKPGQSVEVEITLPVALGYGTYNLSIAIHEDETHLQACYEWVDNAAFFKVHHQAKPDWSGILRLKPELDIKTVEFDLSSIGEALDVRFPQIPDPSTAEENNPSPYVSGFGPPVPAGQGMKRTLRSRGTFVFHPRHRFLRFTIEDSEEFPRESQLWRLIYPALGEDPMSPVEATGTQVFFELPDEATGRTGLFTIETPPGSEPSILKIASVPSLKESP